MANYTPTTSGNAAGIPKPTETQAPQDPPIQWVTGEEAETLNKILFKDFIRKSELKPGDNKKFIYRPTGLRPYVPSRHNGIEITTQTNQNLVMVTVVKYYRAEFIKAKRREAGVEIEEEVNKPVIWSEYDNKSGTWTTIDQDANFDIDSRKFLDIFKRDTE